MQTYWNEGPQTCNVRLKHNTFYDIDGISCRIGIEVPDGTSSGSRDQQNIDIEDNLFLSGGNHDVWNGIMPRGVALLIGNVHGAVVKNNVFAGFPNASVVVYSSDNVAISDNVFLNTHTSSNRSQNWPRSANVDPGSLITVNHSSQVSLDGNLLYNDGPFASKLVAVGPDVSGMEGADTGVDPRRASPLPGRQRGDSRCAIECRRGGAGRRLCCRDRPGGQLCEVHDHRAVARSLSGHRYI